jgi:uncharacterized protein involved in exopolysaccharide biosynthesis
MSSRWNHPETLRDLRRVVVRYRRRFVLLFFAVATTVLLVGLLLPRRYEASAVFERRNDLVMSEIAGRGAPQSFGMLKRSLAQELRGRPAIERVIDDLGLAPKPAPGMPEEQARAMQLARLDLLTDVQRNLTVRFDISTSELDRVRLVYIGDDPQVTRRVTNRLVTNYIETARSQIDRMLTQAATFFEQQADTARQRINELEDQKLKFEVAHAGMLPHDSVSVQQQLTENEDELLLLDRRALMLNDRIDKLERALADHQSSGPSRTVRGANPEYVRIEKELTKVEHQLEQALIIQKMTAKHPTVQALQQKVAGLRELLRSTPTEVVTEKYFGESGRQNGLELALIDARNERDSIQQESAVVRKRVAELRARTAEFVPVRTEYRRIERELTTANGQLAFWSVNLRRINMALTAELGQRGISLNFISPCSAISRPSSPKLTQIMFAAMALGLLAAVAGVLLADRTDQTIHSLEQANRTMNITVLGAVAEIITHRQASMRRLYYKMLVPAAVGGLLLLMVGTAYLNYVNLQVPQVVDTEDIVAEPSTINPALSLIDTPTAEPGPIFVGE